jgi:hypothetical protein
MLCEAASKVADPQVRKTSRHLYWSCRPLCIWRVRLAHVRSGSETSLWVF